ncbi:MAG TPA: alkaline phosphatase family protein [Kofleriaceae bacterium]|jgi:phospholipase C|nr:alkaline phosphatase family protein [Kofleriaceae bacterium]
MMKRRDALKTLGGLGAAAGMARFLPGCSGGGDGPHGITTYVYMMMENRSYDHLFGARAMAPESKPGDGLPTPTTFSNLDLNGVAVSSFTPDKNSLCAIDPPHDWDAARAAWNMGANDGFLAIHQTRHKDATAQQPMQYLVRNDVPVSWALADAYATSDRWFCAVMGPTLPNRYYWHAGSSEGRMDNTLPTGGLSGPSIFHRLDDKGIAWKYYYGNVAVASLYNGLDVNRMQAFEHFLADAKAGTLPPVVYIDPAFDNNDDHPPIHPIHGQELIASVYNALATSPQWKNCLLLITYDENGGFFDHVSPPTTVDERAAQGFNQLGFRVPAIVAGPYVKQGHVSSLQYEHCSGLRELEAAFDLEPINQRTMAARDLSDFIDADRLARGDWAKPITLPSVDPDDTTLWPMSATCMPGPDIFPMARHPVIEWADSNPPQLAGLDLRPQVAEYRRAIRQSLAQRSK